jgi:hypothetical protein
MKKIIIMAALCVASVQGYGATPEQIQALEMLKEEILKKIQIIEAALRELKMPKYRDQLIDLVFGYFVLDDICKAENAADVLGMPWVSFICPKNQSVELRQSECYVRHLDPERLSDITYPGRTLSLVANGKLIDPGKQNWTIYAISSNSREYNEYYKYFHKMGVLAEFFLEAQKHPGQAIWPQNVQNSSTYPDSENYPLINEDGTPNEKSFITWYENIYEAYDRGPVPIFYPIVQSIEQNIEGRYSKQQIKALWQNASFMEIVNETILNNISQFVSTETE